MEAQPLLRLPPLASSESLSESERCFRPKRSTRPPKATPAWAACGRGRRFSRAGAEAPRWGTKAGLSVVSSPAEDSTCGFNTESPTKQYKAKAGNRQDMVVSAPLLKI